MHAIAPPALRLAPRAGVCAAFTGRSHGNVSLLVGGGDPAGARRALGPLAGLAPERTVFMEQVHGASVAVVGPADAGRGLDDHRDALPGVDALVTAATDLALVVLTADCAPVLLAGDHAVGAVHAGRRGLLGGVIEATLAAMGALGERAEDLTALIGPAVGGCCYELPEAEAEQAWAALPALRARTTWGTPSLDVRAGAAAVLRAAGVEAIAQADGCTRCGADGWFSHRAATDGREPRAADGRQASVISCDPSLPARGLPPGMQWLA